MSYREIKGNLIKLAKEGEFDVITHGCNCFCTMGAGLAPQMAKAFGCDEFRLEASKFRGDIRKLGNIDYMPVAIVVGTNEFDFCEKDIVVVNSYTQYRYGKNHPDGVYKPVDYEAITLCMRKINHIFKGRKIGLPKIGCQLAGGDWNIVKEIIQKEFKDCEVTVVILEK